MRCWALWCGGPNYSPPERDDLEEFRSLRAAMNVFRLRIENADYPATPCVDDSRMLVFLSKPNLADPDWIPDRLIVLGPRDGIRVERL